MMWFFLSDIFFTHISNVIPFSSFPSKTSYPLPSSPAHSPLTGPGICLHWGFELSQDQVPLLPLMSNKAILCYICSWSHGSLHVYPLVGDLVLGSSGGFWLVDIVILSMGLQASSASSVLSLTLPLGSTCSVQLLAVNMQICIWQAQHSFSENSYIRPLSACTSWHP